MVEHNMRHRVGTSGLTISSNGSSSYHETLNGESSLSRHSHQQNQRHHSSGRRYHETRSSNLGSRRYKFSPEYGWKLLMFFLSFICVALVMSSTFFARNKYRNGEVATVDDSRNRYNRSPTFVSVEEMKDKLSYDLIVVGSGPAGLSAAIYASRAGWSVLVTGSIHGGMLSQSIQLENFPSYWLTQNIIDKTNNNANTSGQKGEDWLKLTQLQAQDLGASLGPPGLLITKLSLNNNNNNNKRDDMAVRNIAQNSEESSDFYELSTTLPSIKLQAKAVILSMGSKSNTLELQSDNEGDGKRAMEEQNLLWGKSLHNCAICDGSIYDKKVVLVVGGGDAAIEAAYYLAQHFAKRVILIHRQNSFSKVSSNKQQLQLLKSMENVHIHTPYIIKRWITTTEETTTPNLLDPTNHAPSLKGAIIENVHTSKIERVLCDGAFIMIGAKPNTLWLKDSGLKIGNSGHILVRKNLKSTSTSTSLPGVFAAGEVVDDSYRQAITAAASGTQAAMDVERYLQQQNYVSIKNSSSSDTKHQKQNLRSQHQQKSQKNDSNKHRMQDGKTSLDDTSSCDMTEVQCLKEIVQKHQVTVFSKPWCPYCHMAIEALSLEGLPNPFIIDLTKQPNTSQIQSALESWTGRRTVPNVFIGGSSIGGGTETVDLQRSGRLKELLQKVGAI